MQELEYKMYIFFNELNIGLKLSKRVERRYFAVIQKLLCNWMYKPNDKLRCHCLSTEKFRTATHQACETKMKKGQSSFVPVLFHTFSKFD